jgi:3-isopropylmalate/(R)-2-methylmalate dehydratase small subunit
MKSALSNSVMRGRVWKFGDSVDTDIIGPGQRAATLEDLKKITMDALRPEFAKEVRPGDIIVGGKSFGFGSHREKANVVLREVGIQAIVAESIARIFFRVGISLGMPTYVAPGITGIVEDGEELEIDGEAGVARNPKTGKSVRIAINPKSVQHIFAAGGIVPLMVQRWKAKQKS